MNFKRLTALMIAVVFVLTNVTALATTTLNVNDIKANNVVAIKEDAVKLDIKVKPGQDVVCVYTDLEANPEHTGTLGGRADEKGMFTGDLFNIPKDICFAVGFFTDVRVENGVYLPAKDADMTTSFYLIRTDSGKVPEDLDPTSVKKDDKKDEFFNTWHDFGTFKVNFTGARIEKDFSGIDALVLTYDWENTGTEAQSPFLTFSLKGFQDGVETEPFTVVMDSNIGEGQKEVKEGGKISGAETIVGITDINKPLVLELDEIFSFSKAKLIETTIDLSELE